MVDHLSCMVNWENYRVTVDARKIFFEVELSTSSCDLASKIEFACAKLNYWTPTP